MLKVFLVDGTFEVFRHYFAVAFRNNLWKDYKTSEGVEPDLLSQFLFSKKFYPSLVREAGRAKKSGKN